jgi:hypothetical protein
LKLGALRVVEPPAEELGGHDHREMEPSFLERFHDE